jgi:hypothetical protein
VGYIGDICFYFGTGVPKEMLLLGECTIDDGPINVAPSKKKERGYIN